MINEFRKQLHNEVLTINDDIYISFNPGFDFSELFGSMLGQMLKNDTNDGETVLVVDNTFFILNGDFRAQYLACEGDIQKIKQVYIDNIDKQSSFSADRTDEEILKDLITKIAKYTK